MDNNVDNFVEKLPLDIKLYIYKNYIEPELYLYEYKKAIEYIESVKLDIIKIRPLLPLLFKNEFIIRNLRTKCGEFDHAYIKHKISKEKMFRLLNNGSFSLCLLCLLYH